METLKLKCTAPLSAKWKRRRLLIFSRNIRNNFDTYFWTGSSGFSIFYLKCWNCTNKFNKLAKK